MKMRSWILGSSKRIESAADNMPSMRLHECSEGVAYLQVALNMLNFLPFTSRTFSKGVPDGMFGEETSRAVMAFQQKHGLKADGVAGRKTLVLMDDLLFAKQHPIRPATPENGRLGRVL